MCKTVVDLMAEGASKAEVAAELGISRETLNEWTKSNQVFSVAIKEGEALSEAWWLKQGRVNLQNKEFSATLWYMNMKNRHGWKDKAELTGAGENGSIQLNLTVSYLDGPGGTPQKT
jgi:hypothetical protein